MNSPERIKLYPSPFLDIAQTYIPTQIKELFKWVRYFFYTESLYGSIIYKMASYPITDLNITSESEVSKKIWDKVLNDNLDIKSFCIETGLDYFVYGNAFVSINLPFKRYIKCKKCGHKELLTEKNFKFRSFRFFMECAECGEFAKAEVEDRSIKDLNGVNLVRWNPENIKIDYNPITGKSRYIYQIPNKIKGEVRLGKKYTLISELPLLFLEAVRKNRDVQLSPDNIMHFKRPTLAEEDMGWGKPIMIHSLKRNYYLHVLRRSQEAIAVQRIIPLDILFPSATATQDPYTSVNLGTWKNNVAGEIEKWRKDPNYISIMPIPVGSERIGSGERPQMLTPEIELTHREIAAGMGVPIEFVIGGLNWSGSSISLKTLENQFLNYRKLQHRLLKFIYKKLKAGFKLPEAIVEFTEFKMADDVQRKQLYMNLNAQGKISDHTLLTEMGIDPKKENKLMLEEAKSKGSIMELVAKTQAEAQGEANIVSQRYQQKVQEMMQEYSESINDAAAEMADTVKPDNQNMVRMDFIQMAQSLAQQLVQKPIQERGEQLAQIQEQWPPLYPLVVKFIGALEQQQQGMQQQGAQKPGAQQQQQGAKQQQQKPPGQIDMKPAPDQKPPRRAGGM